MKLVSHIFFLIFLLLSLTTSAQEVADFSKGGLERKQVTNYWDRDSTKIRSRGHYNVSGFSGVGQKTGIWTYWHKNGEVEESSVYVNGKYHGKVTQLYPNGKTKNVGYFKYGIQDSIFTSFYENGKVQEKGQFAVLPDSILMQPYKYWNQLDYVTPIKIGKWNYFYENGKPQMTFEYKLNDTNEYLLSYWNEADEQTVIAGNGFIKEFYGSKKPKIEKNYTAGLLDGNFTEWNANGTVKLEGRYKNNEKEGEWKSWYFVSHTLHQLITYKNSEKHGAFKEYNPNEVLVIDGVYEEGEKEGVWKYYFDDGNKDMFGNFSNGLQHGHWDYWYPNGKLYYKGDYNEGKKTGEWNFFYNTGEPWKTGSYEQDLKEGLWTSWYESGQDAFEGIYKAGLEHGVWTSWYENGVMKDRGSYANGKMSATWTGWYPNDKKRYEGTYKDDMKDGKWMYWTDKGILKDEGYFAALKRPKKKNDIVIESVSPAVQSYKHGKWISYDPNGGAIASEGTYSYGKQDGTWKFYFPGGKIIATENNFKEGKLNGVSSTFTRRGNNQTIIAYKDGKKHGEMKVYDAKGKRLIAHKLYKDGEFKKNLLSE